MSFGTEAAMARELEAFVDRTEDLTPIGPTEYRARLAQVQAVMQKDGLDAVYLDAGTNLAYFTGIVWHPSERLAGALIPATGEPAYLVPHFERGTFSALIQIDADIHGWHEHENPCLLLKSVLAARGLSRGWLGVDPNASFGLAERLREALAPAVGLVSAGNATAACRSVKSSAEIALMQRAHDITLAVQRATARILRPGISAQEVQSFIDRAHRASGAPAGSLFCIVLFGADTQYPHGVKAPKRLEQGDMVLVDTGCTLHGYHSDITRSYVFGTPTDRQRQVWQHERTAQDIAFHAARIGMPCGSVDDAVRDYLSQHGYGPDYRLPGLPHRTGHGIGLDIHEAPNFVRGETTTLAEGMCLSIEPMLCIPGEFGVRLEDHIHMTGNGPCWFTTPAPSIEEPFGLAG